MAGATAREHASITTSCGPSCSTLPSSASGGGIFFESGTPRLYAMPLARIIHGREEPDRQVAEWSPAGSQPSSVRIAPLAAEMVNFNAVGVQVGIVKLAVNPSGE
jgi:hypothetical protein